LRNKKYIYITGSSGFIGSYFLRYFENLYSFKKYIKENTININEDIVIHLAGKAHDLKNISNSNEYYQVNTELTKSLFDAFLNSNAQVFITMSSVKAVADEIDGDLTEEHIPNPITHYGKSKLLAEQYILSKTIPEGKRVYILRPCMIHGPGNKGNLNLLYKIVKKRIPWPLGGFKNKRSFCSIDNLMFIINELIERDDIPSGVYNIADDDAVSTNELIQLIAESQDSQYRIWNISPILINFLAKIGDIFKLPLNTERLNKLTETYIVSNIKIKNAINKPLPVSSRNGLINTLHSFNINA
jgi:nucleoside-diphosphate-sugar epimerase